MTRSYLNGLCKDPFSKHSHTMGWDRWEFSVTFKDAIQNMTELSVFGQRPTWSASNRETEVLSGRTDFSEVLSRKAVNHTQPSHTCLNTRTHDELGDHRDGW